MSKTADMPLLSGGGNARKSQDGGEDGGEEMGEMGASRLSAVSGQERRSRTPRQSTSRSPQDDDDVRRPHSARARGTSERTAGSKPSDSLLPAAAEEDDAEIADGDEAGRSSRKSGSRKSLLGSSARQKSGVSLDGGTSERSGPEAKGADGSVRSPGGSMRQPDGQRDRGFSSRSGRSGGDSKGGQQEGRDRGWSRAQESAVSAGDSQVSFSGNEAEYRGITSGDDDDQGDEYWDESEGSNKFDWMDDDVSEYDREQTSIEKATSKFGGLAPFIIFVAGIVMVSVGIWQLATQPEHIVGGGRLVGFGCFFFFSGIPFLAYLMWTKVVGPCVRK